MKENNCGSMTTLPRGLHKRGRSWTLDKTFNGKRIRISLGKGSKSEAIDIFHEVCKKLESGVSISVARSETVSASWHQEIERTLAGKQSWLRSIYTICKAKAKSRNIEFHLSFNDLINLALKSNGVCQVSGIPFSLGKRNGARAAPYRPSIDRVNSNDGYRVENCRLVCSAVNTALSDHGDEVFHRIALGYVSRFLGGILRHNVP